VFFGRFVSVLRTYAAFLAGTARMHWAPFVIFNAAGGIVWATAWGVAAFYAGGTIRNLSTPVDIALGAFAVLIVVAIVLVLRRTEQSLMSAAERAIPGPLEDP
jgi:membrane protein DedA with SNARE-associated domain